MSNYRIVYSSELYHHGVNGQKWGVRRFQNEDGTLTAAGKSRKRARQRFFEPSIEKKPKKISPAKALADETKNAANESSYTAGKLGGIKRNKERYEKQQEARKMSDAELRNAINRLNLERQYSDLSTRDYKSGYDTASEVLSIVGSVAAIGASAATITAIVSQMR